MQPLTRGGSRLTRTTSRPHTAPLRRTAAPSAAAAARRRTSSLSPRASSEASGGSDNAGASSPRPLKGEAEASGGGGAPSSAPRPLELDAKGEAEWRRIDKKVNRYPTTREFKAIGVDELGPDGSTFAAAMTRAVSVVTGPLHVECVSTNPSRNGRYAAVTIGPVVVHSPEQVITIFKNFQSDPRCKFCM
jgi:putative lipoic acid-binding regulatory protein